MSNIALTSSSILTIAPTYALDGPFLTRRRGRGTATRGLNGGRYHVLGTGLPRNVKSVKAVHDPRDACVLAPTEALYQRHALCTLVVSQRLLNCNAH